MRHILLTTLAFSLLAGAAQAATDGEAVMRKRIALQDARPTSPATAPMNYRRFIQSKVPGIAQTSVTSRFAKRDDAFTDAGLLCGLQPHPDTAGAAAAFGHDPDGKFVGAKLRMSF